MQCAKCKFSCEKKGDWARHIKTKKHNAPPLLICECGKTFTGDAKGRPAFSYHNKKCMERVLQENKDLRLMLMEQQKQMSELIPKVGHKFNLNVFLQETCKEAMTWAEFVNSLQIRLGLGLGVAQVICDGLHDLGVHRRPIHCVDAKRQRLCLKTEACWEHDPEKIEKTLQSTATRMQSKWLKEIKVWENENPNWWEVEEKAETYAKLVHEALAEIDDSDMVQSISKIASLHKELR
jgi:hypothetical protein